MKLIDLMEERYSVRSFTDQPVEEEKVEAILRAAKSAPTACNYQPQKILLIQSPEGLEKWRKCTGCHFNEQLFLICYDRDLSWKRPYDGKDSGYVDASIVTTQMMLEAWEQGVGSTWVMFFDPEAVRREFSLPENIEAVAALPMGYASEKGVPGPKHASRKDLSETVVKEQF